MAATRKSAKRPSSKKQAGRKSASKRRGKKSAPKATALKRRARKGLKAARGSLGSVLRAGKKTWEKLKSTTTDVIG